MSKVQMKFRSPSEVARDVKRQLRRELVDGMSSVFLDIVWIRFTVLTPEKGKFHLCGWNWGERPCRHAPS